MTAGSASTQVFLLSPAHCGGKRAQLLLSGRGRFPLAERLRTGARVSLGEAFSFLSGLYFRGKLAYAERFARPPVGVPGVQVITTNRGLLPADAPVTRDDLRSFGATEIRADEPEYHEPLRRGVEALDAAVPPGEPRPQLVLLGSVATGKYVDVLLEEAGGRLLFPVDFVGRGDMSRGALLLRAAREGLELPYRTVAGAVRHGARPPSLHHAPSDD
jgi:hypothetical protein